MKLLDDALNGSCGVFASDVNKWIVAGLGIVSLVCGPSLFVVWRWLRRSTSNTSIAWQLTAGLSFFSVNLCFVVEDFLLKNHAVCKLGWGYTITWDEYFYYIGGVRLFCLLVSILSFLFVVFHGQIFSRISSWFDRNQRLLDGAFVASLVEGKDSETLLRQAKGRFRGVPLENMTLEVLASNKATKEEAEMLSVPCELGEVDFFMSHAWNDPPEGKVAALQRLGEEFEAVHGRKPLIWLDKLCINQDNIQEDLECLPIFLMGCQNMLLMLGEQYPTRLWCVLELYVFFSMQPDIQKFKLQPIGNDAGEKDLAALMEFTSANAHCWSKDDEQKIRSVLSEDVAKFDRSVCEVASQLYSSSSSDNDKQSPDKENCTETTSLLSPTFRSCN